jgi:hypothetical protein
MAESRSWAIITALAAQLGTITVANGYLMPSAPARMRWA